MSPENFPDLNFIIGGNPENHHWAEFWDFSVISNIPKFTLRMISGIFKTSSIQPIHDFHDF